MSGSIPAASGADGAQPTTTIRPRALAEIRYNSIANSEVGTSSEEDAPEIRRIAPKDAQDLVGVSLGRAQSRLAWPQTPAEEKAAAIEDAGGFFEGPPIPENLDLDEDSDINDLVKSKDGAADTPSLPRHISHASSQASSQEEVRPSTRPSRANTDASHVRLPSPWRSGPKQFKRSDYRSAFKEGIRRRASSGPEGQPGTLESWKDAFMSSIPSLPKHFTFNSPFSFGSNDDHKGEGHSQGMLRRSGSLFASWSSSTNTSPTRVGGRNSVSTPLKQSSPNATPNDSTNVTPIASPALETLPTRQISRTRSGLGLRRSASDTSLQTFRSNGTALSRAPSLGDDSRFEHVQAQVNSRMKAIKDSWQDSNMKIPGRRAMTNLPHMGSFSHLSLNTLGDRKPGTSNRSVSTVNHHKRTISGQVHEAPKAVPHNVRPQSARPAARGRITGDGKSTHAHPHFTKAVSELTGDVVILGGYRGSILRSAEAPHRQLWVPIKVGLNIRKVDLEVGLNAEDDERAEEKIIPSGMLTHIGPVDISRRLFKRLRASDNARDGQLRVHDYGYDWRLEPLFLSKKLIQFLESLPCNQPGTPKEKRGATVIAHSLGGLITRHAVNQRPELFAGVVYAGVPSTCVNILGPFRNGDDVLLSSRVLTAQVNFTIRTSFALLPLNGRCFFNRETKEEYPVDFFDPQTWIDNRLSPCVARPLPSLNAPPSTGLVAGIMSSMANALPTRKSSMSMRSKQAAAQHPAENAAGGLATLGGMGMSEGGSETAAARGNVDIHGTDNLSSSKRIDSPSSNSATAAEEQSTSIATAVTISREDAIAYLTRILASVKKFKQELDFRPSHAEKNVYPPAAVIYGKTTPTVYGARVVSREAIQHASAYDDLAFASGDGVVLARAAMLPEGYQVAKGGIVCSERGHVTLLGDLEAVGKCLRSIQIARRKGAGLGGV